MLPDKLYKYRAFDSISLRLLCESEAWYSAPSVFNDPLESLPELIDDLDYLRLEALHDHLNPDRGPELRNHYRWSWTEDGDDWEASREEYCRRVRDSIRDTLAESFDSRGVLTLSRRWDSPLMWSHYADSHRGFCIEYDATNHRCKYISPVRYDQQRGVRLSDVYKWKVEQDESGLKAVVDGAFFSKASDWAYEDEWRDISRRKGAHSAPFKVSGVIFGLRCPSQVRTAIMLTFTGTGGASPDFYEAFFDRASFEMRLRPIDPNEDAFVRPSASMVFGSQEDPELPFDLTE